MVYEIIFSERASQDLTSILKYLETQWSIKTSFDFVEILEKKITLIRSNPYLYPSFKNNRPVRKCVLNKQVTLYYRIKNHEVQIITLFNNRKNPLNLKIT